jgi:hypothetical protein
MLAPFTSTEHESQITSKGNPSPIQLGQKMV